MSDVAGDGIELARSRKKVGADAGDKVEEVVRKIEKRREKALRATEKKAKKGTRDHEAKLSSCPNRV